MRLGCALEGKVGQVRTIIFEETLVRKRVDKGPYRAERMPETSPTATLPDSPPSSCHRAERMPEMSPTATLPGSSPSSSAHEPQPCASQPQPSAGEPQLSASSSAPPDALAKKARVLKMLGSDELGHEEREAHNWEQLLLRIKAAAKADQMYNPDTASSGTVHFWCLQVVEALKSARASQESSQGGDSASVETNASFFHQHFPGYLLKASLGPA